jgi:hypothetical protein
VKEAREPFVAESFALPVLLAELLFWLHVPDHATAGLVSSTRIAPGVGEGVGEGDGVVVEPVPDVTSNASTHTHNPCEDVPFFPETSIDTLWLPEARPLTEYSFACACASSGAAYVSTVAFKTSST